MSTSFVLFIQAINSEIAVELYNRIGGINRGVRFDSESLCDQCVKNRCRQIILTHAIAGDTKLVADLLKEPVDTRWVTLFTPNTILVFISVFCNFLIFTQGSTCLDGPCLDRFYGR